MRRILVVGGSDGNHYLNDVEVIDLHTGGRECLVQNAHPDTKGYAIGTYVSGSPLVCGGNEDGSFTDKCHSYHFESMSWTRQPDLMQVRSYSASTLLPNQTFLAIGGNGNDNAGTTSEMFFGDVWHVGPSPPHDMAGHCVVLINETHVFVAGDASGADAKAAQILDVTTGNWTTLDPMGDEEREAAACGLVGHKEIILFLISFLFSARIIPPLSETREPAPGRLPARVGNRQKIRRDNKNKNKNRRSLLPEVETAATPSPL